ncbi:MAG: hypothetical protein F6K54_19790 [Okeania sp. SIO3B5]|uniref:hypothetical protein n=1 Tax=Okeania sp. SIO3B5 TaxID=2607811 RepID=UPI0014013F17|nr:hypothetical protein [Okeania sp. SIO3B5]NEO55121.1 hypothetical protein [Okeania sp. SIO3B5]
MVEQINFWEGRRKKEEGGRKKEKNNFIKPQIFMEFGGFGVWLGEGLETKPLRFQFNFLDD